MFLFVFVHQGINFIHLFIYSFIQILMYIRVQDTKSIIISLLFWQDEDVARILLTILNFQTKLNWSLVLNLMWNWFF